MTLNNPSLTLTFLEDNTTIVIDKNWLLNGSVTISNQLLNNMESSSNKATLKIKRNCPAILSEGTCILNTNKDIKAVLKEGTSTLFTGYLNEKFSWSVSSSGESTLSVTIEDNGTRLLPKPYFKVGSKQLLEGMAKDVIEELAETAGIELDTTFPNLTEHVSTIVEAGTTCQDLLKSLMYELGYAYYFTSYGKLAAKKIDCGTVENLPLLDRTKLWVVGNNCITLSKSIMKYRSSKVTYKSLADREDALIYKDISGQDETHEDCNIPLEAGQTYPDREEGNVSYIEATDLDNGKELYYITNIVPEVEWSSGAGNYQLTKFGEDTLSVLVNCTRTGALSKLQARADIRYIDAENIIIAGETSNDTESDNIIEYDCRWLHTKTGAELLANLLVEYNTYCNRQFTFYSKTAYEFGTLVKIKDDVFSGITANVMITGVELTDKDNVYKYTAISIDRFELSKTVEVTPIFTPPVSSVTKPGPRGADGKSAYEAAVEGGYTGTEEEFNTQLADGGLEFNLRCNPSTLTKDRRSNLNQLLNLTAQVKGFSNYQINYRIDSKWVASEWTVTTNTGLLEYYKFTQASSFDSSKTYATKSGNKYTECVNLESFEQGKTYYKLDIVDTYSTGVCDISFDAHSDSIIVELPFRNEFANSIDIELYNKDVLMDSIPVDVVETTPNWRYLGAFNSSPIDSNGLVTGGIYVGTYALEGDIYLDTSGTVYVPKMLDRNLADTKLIDAAGTDRYNEKVLTLIPDLFNSSVENRLQIEGYDFFKNIIADNVTASYIGSKNIQILNGGSISSGTIDSTKAWGERVTSPNGFLLDSTGNMEARNVYLRDVYASNMQLDEDCSMGGEIVNDVIKTNLAESTDTVTYSSNSSSKNPSAFLASEAKSYIDSWVSSNMSSGTKYSASGVDGNRTYAGAVYYSSTPPETVSLYSNSKWWSDSSQSSKVHGSPTCAMKIRVRGITPCNSNFFWKWQTPYVKIKINDTEYTVVSSASGGGADDPTSTRAKRKSFDVTYTVPAGSDWTVYTGPREYTLNDESGELYVEEKPSSIYSAGLNLFTSGGSTVYKSSDLFSSTYVTFVPTLAINGSRVFDITISSPSTYPSSIHPLYTFSWTGTAPAADSWSFFNSSSLVLTDDRGVYKNLSNWISASWDSSMIKANTDSDSATLSNTSYVRSFSVSFQRKTDVKAVYTKHIIPKDDSTDTWDIGNGDNMRYRNVYAQNVSCSKLTINGVSYNLSVSGSSLVLTR